MMFKHTPGPWWASSTEVGTVPMMDIKICKASGANHEEAKANAHLIAASPQMHDLLNAFIAATEGVFECGHIRTNAMKLMEGIENDVTTSSN